MNSCCRVFGAVVILLVGGVAHGAQPVAETRKTVMVLATGGTIAGTRSETGGALYRSGAIPIAAVLQSVPGLGALANIASEQVANVGSADVDEVIWRRLLVRVQAALADPNIAGIVITHGTDTLEETAYFLNLVVPSSKPIVLVGAMRPAAAASADGPENLLDAVRVASSDDARNRGVLVVMNDTILDPVSVTKVDFRRVNGFDAPGSGPIGDIIRNTPRFYRSSVGHAPAFEVGKAPLPRIAITYTYAGFKARDLQSAAEGARGLIIAGAGSGGLPTDARGAMRQLMASGMSVVRTARQGSGDVWPPIQEGAEPAWTVGTIAGRELSPAKARILLMLALQKPRSKDELQSLFDRYGLVGR